MDRFEQLKELKNELLSTPAPSTSSAFHAKIKCYEDALKDFHNKELSSFISELRGTKQKPEKLKTDTLSRYISAWIIDENTTYGDIKNYIRPAINND